MDLQTIFDEFSIADLMAPSAELSFIQDAKFHVNDVSVQQEQPKSIAASDAYNCLDVPIRQPQLDEFLTLRANEHGTNDDSTITESSAFSSQHLGTSPLPYGIDRNTSDSIMNASDEFLFDGMNRNFEEPKHKHSLRVEYSDSSFSIENFTSQQSSQSATFSSSTRDAFTEQVQDGYFPHKLGMIPSVVDHGAEVLAAAAAVKEEHQAHSHLSDNQSLVANYENKEDNASRRVNTGSGRRRSAKGPKPKLHQRTEPYSDAGMETKRRNAIKAHKNRQKAKEERESMEAEISRLKNLVQEKEDIIQRLTEERRLERANRIKILREELAALTTSFNPL